MEKDIHTLIKRFMAGQTSIEEEDRIAEYLRTHDVGEDLQPYKEMFAWFDQGMPLGSQQEDEETSQRGDKSTRGQGRKTSPAFHTNCATCSPPQPRPSHCCLSLHGQKQSNNNWPTVRQPQAFRQVPNHNLRPTR